MSATPMTRWKAASIHIAISATIALIVTTLMLMLWYMPPLLAATGGGQLLLILLGVDITLGPLLTLLIFNPQKSRKELTIDLTLIGLLQMCALVYGIYTVFETRPVFSVFYKNAFYLVNANFLRAEDLSKISNPNDRRLSLTGPIYVYTEMPSNKEARDEVIKNMYSGKGITEFPQYYQPYAEKMSAAASAAHPLAELQELNPSGKNQISSAIAASGRSEAELGYLPMRAKHQDLAVLVGKSDGKVLGLLKLQPWN